MQDELIERIEMDGIDKCAKEVWRLFYPEPDKGPWYWPKTKWQKWDEYRWWFERKLLDGDWFYSLLLLYGGRLPDMIHSDPNKAFAHAIRAKLEAMP
jgi:hypothetical protein